MPFPLVLLLSQEVESDRLSLNPFPFFGENYFLKIIPTN